jgi:hypothetical protein
MAIKNESQTTSNQNQSTGQQTNAGQQQYAGQATSEQPGKTPGANNGSWSFHAGGLFGAPISKSIGSESLVKLVKALGEIYQQTNPDVEVTVLTIDRGNERALAFSCIVVCLRLKEAQKTGVAYHVLIVEATGDDIKPIYQNINNSQVEVMRLANDAMDDKLIGKVLGSVQRAFPQGPWHLVDGCVIPRNFNVEDAFLVHNLALNAGLACGTELKVRTPGFEDMNLASAKHDSNLIVNIGFNRQDLCDAVGQPMRSDVLINFMSKKNQPNNNQQQQDLSVNVGDQEAKISELSAFVDVLWAPVADGGANIYAMQNQQAMTQKFAARMVITNLASSFSYTPASILLSIATSMSMSMESNWFQAFRPQHVNAGEIDMYDIGALNIEGKYDMITDPVNYSNPNIFGIAPDTKSETFQLADLGRFIAALVRPGLVISVDVPECNPQTWYLSVFAAAASGNPQAYELIYGAAQELTNNNFGKYFNKGMPMFEDVGQRIHLGTWRDKNGDQRDIRHFDYLAVANLVGRLSPQTLRDWSDTFTRTQYPLAQRLDARKKMIMGLSKETAIFTGYAQRVTFAGIFLQALGQGCADAGLNAVTNTPLSASDFNNQRGVASFVGSALVQPGQTFMSRNMGYQGNFNNQQFGYNRFI